MQGVPSTHVHLHMYIPCRSSSRAVFPKYGPLLAAGGHIMSTMKWGWWGNDVVPLRDNDRGQLGCPPEPGECASR